MKYREIAEGIFLDRPNRFIAHVDVNGTVETVHVKNTGRCRELLLPGAAVRLEVSDNPKRKTKYDLVRSASRNLAGSTWTVRHPYFPDAPTERGVKHLHELFLLCHVGRDSLEIVEQREG